MLEKTLVNGSTSEAYRYILASRSPRRLELLRLIVPAASIEVLPPRSPHEASFDGLPDRPAIDFRFTDIARAKCDDVREQLSQREASESDRRDGDRRVIIAADTVIIATDVAGRPVVLGQPPEDEFQHEAVRLWFRELFAGRTHEVVTALCVAMPDGKQIERISCTTVWFRPDVERYLDWYLSTGEPRGKAGGYAIQGAGSVFVLQIDGSLSNVIGLPLEELLDVLSDFRV